MDFDPSNVNIRLTVGDEDAASIQRLARLAYADAPNGPALLAEVDGEPVAAIGFADGRQVGDPERATPALFRFLRIRRLETRAVAWVFGA
jgi:hypothetical protein